MRIATAMLTALVLAASTPAASRPVTRTELDRLVNSDVHGWRFKVGEVPGAPSADIDDSDWALVDVGYKWWPHDSTCWFRKRITIPDRINDVDVTGATVRLRLGVDNEAKAYVDGAFKQQFTWADGNLLLTEHARPGQMFRVEIHGINRRGYGQLSRAYLTSTASEKMVAALRSLLHDVDVAIAQAHYAGREQDRCGEALAREVYQKLDLTAYRARRQEAFLASVARARARLLPDPAAFESRLRRVGTKLAALKKRIEQGKKAGLQLAYRRAEARVVESFLQYARDDMTDEAASHKTRARAIAMFLETLCDRALRQTSTALENPTRDLRVPMYRTGKVAIRNGAFWQNGRPVFFTGVGHFSQVRRDTPILTEYGLNIIQIEMGPTQALPDPDTVNEQAIRESVVRPLDNAARHDVAVNLLVSPHYFPRWAIDRNPALAKCGRGFIKYCIEAPDARAVIEKFLRALMPMIANHPALHSICLSNEPQYTGKCDYARAKFHKWLAERHGTVQALNEICGTHFDAFADVSIPPDASSNYALYFDWCRFNQDRFLAFHAFERDIIHEYDPDLPVHAKVQAHTLFQSNYFETGINREQFDHLGSITGNDCVQYFVGDGQGAYLQEWLKMAMSYTLQRCTTPAHPIFNSEDHVIVDGDWRFIPASHIRTAYWTQALHGQGAATTWVWERGQTGNQAENILTRPNCVLAIGRIGLDLDRLAREVVALQRRKADLAILYSYASVLQPQGYDVEAKAAFEGAYFTDAPCDFVTETQAVAGKLKDYKIVVVPRAPHAPDRVVKAFQDYLASGGTVMTVGRCFSHDEYGRPRATRLKPSGRGRLVAYPDSLTARVYRDILSRRLDVAGVDRPVRIVGEHGESVWGVNVRTAAYDGKLLVALVNFLRQAQTIDFKTTSPIASIVNLFDNTEVTLPVTLPPLEPALLLVELGGS